MMIKQTDQIKPAKETKPKKASHHDKFFKQVFSAPEFILDLLGLAFSKEELSVFDLSQVQLEKDSWANIMADLVVSLPLKSSPKERIRVFILLEHKAQYNVGFFNQLFKYLYGIHDQTFKMMGRPSPAYCVVFYHGKAPWNHPTSFQEALWGDIFRKNPLFPRKGMIDYEIRLINARAKGFQALIKSLGAYAPLNLMDRVWFLKNSLEETKSAMALFGGGSKWDEDLVLKAMEYLESAGVVDRSRWDSLEGELVREGTFKTGGLMNIKEDIRQRGVQEGLQQGVQQGLQQGVQQVALNMLRNRLEISQISKMTGLPEKEIEKLKNGSA